MQICRVLFLFALCSILTDGLWAQSLADLARKQREKNQAAPTSTPRIYTNENIPHEGGLSIRTPSSPSPSPRVALNATPNAAPGKSSADPLGPYYRPLLILGFVLAGIGGLWMLVVTFRTGIWWGLGCLFVPFVQLFYCFSYWKEARWPFWLQTAGVALVVTVRMAVPGIHLLPR